MRSHPALGWVSALLCVVAIASVSAADNDGAIRFGLFADLHAHDTDSPLEGKWMTNTAGRLSAFVDAMDEWRPDFVIELGDFVNGWVVLGADPGDPDRIPAILAWAEGLYAAFEGPRFHVIGNHDVYNLTKEQYCSVLGIDATYFSFDVGTYHFVVLDVQFAVDGADLANTYTGVAGYVPAEEIEWLRDDLAASDRPTIVFVHQMLDAYIEEWGRPLIANQPEVQDALAEDGDVIAVFQGHDHENHYTLIDGIHYVTFEALVDQGTPPSWATVTLDPTARTITIVGEGDQADYVLEYETD